MASQELQEIIEEMRERARANQGGQQTIEERRAGSEAQGKALQDLTGVTTEPVDAGGVPAEWVVASDADPNRVVLHLHGGGYVVGGIVSHRGLSADLSRATKSRVLIIDYRLAPEHPFPAAVDDARAAYRWLLENGADPARIIVEGESAGGGLAIALTVSLRDAGVPLPAGVVCVSPWVDMEGTGESMTTRSHLDPMIQREGLLDSARMYLAGADPKTPLASPLYADLSGLPPLLIQVGTSEVLLDDSTRLAERARAAGVEVVLETWDEMVHVWHRYASRLPEARQALERIGEFAHERFGAAVA